MNNQQIFDRVAQHLLAQNKRASNSKGSCFYRSSKGLTCAIGCLIPKALYIPLIEGVTVEGVLNLKVCSAEQFGESYDSIIALQSVLNSAGMGYRNFRLLKDLQSVHDEHNVSHWKLSLKRVARHHKLKYSHIIPITGE